MIAGPPPHSLLAVSFFFFCCCRIFRKRCTDAFFLQLLTFLRQGSFSILPFMLLWDIPHKYRASFQPFERDPFRYFAVRGLSGSPSSPPPFHVCLQVGLFLFAVLAFPAGAIPKSCGLFLGFFLSRHGGFFWLLRAPHGTCESSFVFSAPST